MIESYPIDFVITWVDSNNTYWLSKKEEYAKDICSTNDVRNRRFRDWGLLIYWFRAVDKYASWVNHIYIVTPGTVPRWLNINNDKITLINQDDLFDEKYRPTFNNCAIELLLHKIPGLSEHFVYFCDDMFLSSSCTPEDFFKKGMPLDRVGFTILGASQDNDGHTFYGIPATCMSFVARFFNKKDVFKTNCLKFLNLRNGRDLLKTIYLLPVRNFTGFNEPHTANSFLKNTFEKVWATNAHELYYTIKSRFRNDYGLSQWCMRYWQICEGTFAIRKNHFSRSLSVCDMESALGAMSCYSSHKYKIVCLNDDVDDNIDMEDFSQIKNFIQNSFEQLLHEKSQFEV